MNEAQRNALKNICERYRVTFKEEDYTVYPASSSMMAGWAEGWVGGMLNTIYVGVSPEGQIHS